MAAFKAQISGELAPFIILIAFLAAVIVFAIIITPEEREKLIGPTYYERTILEVTPGFIKAAPIKTYTYEYPLSDLDIDYSEISEPQKIISKATIYRSLISDKPAIFPIKFSKNFTEASIDFNILTKEGSRELLVYLNNELIFSSILEPGSHSISLPKEKLNKTNTIKIAVAPPGVKFWESTYYVISDVKLVIKSYSLEKAKVSQIFTISDNVLTGLTKAYLSGYAKQLGKATNISIFINDQLLWVGIPSEVTGFNVDIPPYLLNKTNTIDWVVAQDGRYQILFAKILFTYSATPYKVPNWKFKLTDDELLLVKSSMANCTLQINATENISDQFTILINNNKITFELKDGSGEANICNYLDRKENTLAIYPKRDLNILNLKLTITYKV
ncbi:MAG: hypothetical protein QXQ79_01945 [Candidatus Nanoarchaeia archaeon]